MAMTAFAELTPCPHCGAHRWKKRWMATGGKYLGAPIVTRSYRCGECAHEYRAETLAYAEAAR